MQHCSLRVRRIALCHTQGATPPNPPHPTTPHTQHQHRTPPRASTELQHHRALLDHVRFCQLPHLHRVLQGQYPSGQWCLVHRLRCQQLLGRQERPKLQNRGRESHVAVPMRHVGQESDGCVRQSLGGPGVRLDRQPHHRDVGQRILCLRLGPRLGDPERHSQHLQLRPEPQHHDSMRRDGRRWLHLVRCALSITCHCLIILAPTNQLPLCPPHHLPLTKSYTHHPDTHVIVAASSQLAPAPASWRRHAVLPPCSCSRSFHPLAYK